MIPTTSVNLTQQELEMLDKVRELVKENVDPETIKRGDAVTIQLDSQTMFDPGAADLIPESHDMLFQSLKPHIFKGVKQIVVEGHTDDVPIQSQKFPSNWELSTARASSVARFIMKEFEFPGKWVKVVGHGHYRPEVPNTSDENRRRNRRVEIKILKPKEN
ncbi:MAG: OmpA family protein [Nitrospinota bacterium]